MISMWIQYKKPSAEKSLPQILAASIVIRSESGAPITTFWYNYYWRCQHLRVVIGGPLSDLITIEAANIWGKLFLSWRPFILVFTFRRLSFTGIYVKRAFIYWTKYQYRETYIVEMYCFELSNHAYEWNIANAIYRHSIL